MKPSIGRIVHYTLGESDVANIVERRGEAHVGNRVEVGQVYPAMIVRVHGDTPTSYVNLQVFLDGRDTAWVTGAMKRKSFWKSNTGCCPFGRAT